MASWLTGGLTAGFGITRVRLPGAVARSGSFGRAPDGTRAEGTLCVATCMSGLTEGLVAVTVVVRALPPAAVATVAAAVEAGTGRCADGPAMGARPEPVLEGAGDGASAGSGAAPVLTGVGVVHAG